LKLGLDEDFLYTNPLANQMKKIVYFFFQLMP